MAAPMLVAQIAGIPAPGADTHDRYSNLGRDFAPAPQQDEPRPVSNTAETAPFGAKSIGEAPFRAESIDGAHLDAESTDTGPESDRVRLFDVIPDRFFSVLASRGKAVYADALFLLYDLYRKNLFGIPREAVVDVLTDLVVEREEAGEMEDDWLADEPVTGVASALAPPAVGLAQVPAPPAVDQPSLPTDPRAKASMILRRLKDAGWVDIEIRINYDEYVNLMDYAIQVLDVLDRIRTRRQAEYRGFVYAPRTSWRCTFWSTRGRS